MSERVVCVYHGGCADGFGAACVVRRALGAGVEFHGADYGDAPPDVAGAVVLVVDFSYPLQVLRAMAEQALQVLVIDHHKTAAADLAELPRAPERYDLWRASGVPLAAIFDMGRSGAGLAWDVFFPGAARPALIDYIEDRDLWRWRLSATREVTAALFSYPQDFDVWGRFLEGGVEHLLAEGVALVRKQEQDVARALEVSTRRMVIGGHDVPVANVPFSMASDAGNVLCEGEPFAATYVDTPLHRVFSLRSARGAVDVGEVARQYGGGGHATAAGFRVPLPAFRLPVLEVAHG